MSHMDLWKPMCPSLQALATAVSPYYMCVKYPVKYGYGSLSPLRLLSDTITNVVVVVVVVDSKLRLP